MTMLMVLGLFLFGVGIVDLCRLPPTLNFGNILGLISLLAGCALIASSVEGEAK
jgi:hypothetical protein